MVRTYISGVSLCLSLAMLCVLPVWAAQEDVSGAKKYSCHLLTRAPELDGDIADDPVLRDLPVAGGWRDLRTGLASARQTSFRMGYTSDALFIAVVCEEPEPAEIRAFLADGEDFRHEDAIELSFSPDGETLLTFTVNAIGSRASSRTLKRWQAAAHVGENYWSTEISLPWEVIGHFPAEEEVWRLNICRSIGSQGYEGYSSWANLEYHPEEVENFGKLRFEAIEPGQRSRIEARIQEHGIREELLIYSRPDSGVILQSGFSEDHVVYNQGPHVAPRLSPDMNRVLFNSIEDGEMGVWIVNRGSSLKKRVCDGSQAAWSPDGRKIVFERAGRLVERHMTSGEERVVSPEGAPALAFPSYVPDPGESPVYSFICTDKAGQHLYMLAPGAEKPLETLAEGEIRSAPRCSPDGKTLAFQDGAHIYLMDFASREVVQLTVEPGVQACPVWAVDGQSLCYARAPSPVAESWDVCHVNLADPGTVNLIERKVHAGFDWTGSSAKPARTTQVPGTQLEMRQARDGVAIENDWLTLSVSRKGAFVIPKRQEGAAGEPIALCVTDDTGRIANELADIHIVRDSRDSVVVKASFLANGEQVSASTIRLPRTRPFIEVALDDVAGRVGFQGDMAFAIAPDRFSNDLVLDSARIASGSVTFLPETPLVLGCLSDSDVMVMLVTSSDAPSFAVTSSDNGGHLKALTAAPGTGSVVIALLAGGRVWQRAELEQAAGQNSWRAKWEKPFHGEWRMAVRGKDSLYSRMWSVNDLSDLGGQPLPVETTFSSPPELAIVYAWGRDVITPATVLVPTDILVAIWGIEDYLARLDVQGVQGYRVADEWTPFRQLALHQPGWHPALAHEEHGGEFGVLEVMGSVFPVNTDGVRSFVGHLGNDATGMLSGLDKRIGEYERFLTDLAAFCLAHQDEDREGFLAAVAAQANELLESSRGPRRTDIAEIDKALRRVLAVVGTRDRLTLSVLKGLARLPGSDEIAGMLEEFESFLAAREGRLWHNDTIRFELWYDDNFMAFSRACTRFLAERQRILSGYRTWVKCTRDRTAQLIITDPEFKTIGDDLRRKTQAILRNRYYLEGDWRGETPLPMEAPQ